MLSLTYVSHASSPLTQRELLQLLRTSREHNQEQGLSGLLVYRDGVFIQVLEGHDDQVTTLYEKIKLDPRHHRVTTVITQRIEHRSFPDWTMGFSNLDDDPEVAALEGYTGLMDEQGGETSPEAAFIRDLFDLADGFAGRTSTPARPIQALRRTSGKPRDRLTANTT